jgi:hypothetical protein
MIRAACLGLGLALLLAGGLPALVRAETQNPAAEVQRVSLKGQVVAKLRGETTQFRFLDTPGDLDATRYFEVNLYDPDAVEPTVVARAKTEPDGTFSLRSVPAGVYTAEVRIPTIPVAQDHGVLYRGRVEIKPDGAQQGLQLPVSFLYIRMQDATGKPFAWNTLRLSIHRTGGDLDQRWGMVVFSRGGLEGAGQKPPDTPDGSILVRLQKGGFSFSWSSKEIGSVIFPLVEEDLAVRYRMTFSVPGTGYKLQRFSAARGKAPAEVECPLQPFAVVAGKVKPEGIEGDLRATILSLSVLDPDDTDAESRPLQYASTNVAADGSFKFPEITAGLIQVSAELVGRTPKQDNARGVARAWFELNEGESKPDVPLVLTPRAFDEPAPGDIFVNVIEGAGRTPVGRIKVELLPPGGKKGASAVTSRDGRCTFTMRRPRPYVLRVTELEGGKPVVTEIPVTEDDVRKGSRKTITLGVKDPVACEPDPLPGR